MSCRLATGMSVPAPREAGTSEPTDANTADATRVRLRFDCLRKSSPQPEQTNDQDKKLQVILMVAKRVTKEKPRSWTMSDASWGNAVNGGLSSGVARRDRGRR